MDMTGRGLIVGLIGLGLLWRWLSQHSPDVANTAKKAAAAKAVSLITKLLK
ncbi:MAG: hypothetical protein ACKOAU_16255 [Pirellula sp.]